MKRARPAPCAHAPYPPSAHRIEPPSLATAHHRLHTALCSLAVASMYCSCFCSCTLGLRSEPTPTSRPDARVPVSRLAIRGLHHAPRTTLHGARARHEQIRRACKTDSSIAVPHAVSRLSCIVQSDGQTGGGEIWASGL